MERASRRLRRADRVLTSREFRVASQEGKRCGTRAFVVLWMMPRRESERARIGLTVSRKVGNAVVRNRIKRRVREWFRTQGRELLGEGSLVVIARRPAGDLRGVELGELLKTLVQRVMAA